MPRPQIDLENVRQLPLTYEATIPEDYLDMMGHMNVRWYTHLFSMAMGGVFRMTGLSHEYMQENHSGMFALESHIRYLSEVRVDQKVSVHTLFLNRSPKRIHVIHFLINHDKRDVAATFEMVSTHIDMRIRRTSPFPDELSTLIDNIVAEHTKLDWKPPLCGSMHA